jgi:hypothetical protein
MNRRRSLSATGLGILLAGGSAAVPREEFAADAEPHRLLQPNTPAQCPRCPQYKVFNVPAWGSVEEVFNAVARQGFQYVRSARRYGRTEFVFVKWVPVAPIMSEDERHEQAHQVQFTHYRVPSRPYRAARGQAGTIELAAPERLIDRIEQKRADAIGKTMRRPDEP